MLQVSQLVQNMAESETLAMSRLSRELKAQGKDIINLSLGEPDFNTPDFIKDAAKKAIDENFSHYTPVQGYDDLLQAICDKLKRDNQLQYDKTQIVVSTGAKQCIANICWAVLNQGDEVVLPAPYWVSYREIVKLAGGVPVEVRAGVEQDFKVTAAQVAAAITPKTKMFLFSSPCNPTGAVFSKEELAAIVEVLAKHPEIIIVSDEIYELISFEKEHYSIGRFEAVANRVVTINGLSKGFAMTGWRLGYLAAPKELAAACNKIQGQVTSATCSITQRAAITALQAEPSKMDYMKEAFLKRRDLMFGLLKEIEGLKLSLPTGAFYLFPDVQSFFGKSYQQYQINNATDLCMYLIHEANVALVPGDAFGAPEAIRFSYATSEDILIEAARRIKEALAKLQ